MTKKEQVYKCLDHLPGDTVPYDVYEGWMWPGITSKLMKATGAADYDDLLGKMGAFCRWITPYYNGPDLPAGAKDRIASPHTMHSLNSSIWGLKPGLKEHGLSTAGHPLANACTADEIEKHPWPSSEWFDYAGLYKQAEKYADYFVIAGGFSPLFYLIADLCGMEKALMDMINRPEIIEAAVDKITMFYKGYFSKIIEICGENIDAIAFGDDFASQSAMLMSPELWRKFFKPAWRELFEIVKKRGLKVMFHSCGSVFKVIPDLLEIGLDILYPVQPKATSMDLVTLKNNFGDKLVFYGGLDVQELLPFGNPDEIRREIVRLTKLFGNGGYILSTSHVIMEDVPLENAMAVYSDGIK